METQITTINKAKQALTEARDIYGVLEIRDKAMAAAVFLDAQGASEAANLAKEVQLRAERKAGAFLREVPRTNKSTRQPDDLTFTQTLEDAEISEPTARRWQASADVPEEVFEQHIAETMGEGKELTSAGVQRIAAKLSNKAHVSHNSGNNEWYTPPEYIEAARSVMGGIDLDPASSEVANKTVKATEYYTRENDGLIKEWGGRVWMNPPYAQPLINDFCHKLITSNIEQACVLVNNATDTKWCQSLLENADAVCFVAGRIRFIDMEGKPSGAPLQGQIVLYFGEHADLFSSRFAEFGMVYYAG